MSYFGFNIQAFVESDMVQQNFSYVLGGAKYLWNNHLAGPARYLWYDVFSKLIWGSFIENMNRIKEGKGMQIPNIDFSPKNEG